MKLSAYLCSSLLVIFCMASIMSFGVGIPLDDAIIGSTVLCALAARPVGSLGMNGIVAREDFNQVKQIFTNAFNPKTIIDMKSGSPTFMQRIANPNWVDGWDAAVAFRLCQSTLIMEQPINQNGAPTSFYIFPVLSNIQNQAAQFNTETRLAQTDSFVPTSVGIFLENPASATDTTFKPITWASPFTFANAAAMQAIYNGNMQLQINNVNYINKWDLWRHWLTAQTQQTAAFGAASPVDQWNGADDCFYPMQPFVIITGNQNIQLSIQLPIAPTAADTFSRIRIMFRGILAQNSTATT